MRETYELYLFNLGLHVNLAYSYAALYELLDSKSKLYVLCMLAYLVE